MARAVAVVALTALAAACAPIAPPRPAPLPTRECIGAAPVAAAEYQQLFDLRRTEAAAADIWSPTPADGRLVWFLADTFVGRQDPRGTMAPGYGFVHDAVKVQTGACLDTLLAGAEGSRTDWFPQPNGSDWYWPAGTYLDGSTVKVFLYLVKPWDNPGEAFDFFVAGMRVATLRSDLRPASISALTPLPDTTTPDEFNIPFGGSVARDDTYVYLYGNVGPDNYVARAAPSAVTTGPWEYWTGLEWSSDAANAGPMQFPTGSPYAQLRVTSYGSGWLGIAKSIDGFTEDVTAWFSPSPEGPWQLLVNGQNGRIASTPTADPDDLTYGAALVNLPGSGWTVIWNVNATAAEVVADIWRYGLKFAAPSNLPPPEQLFPVGP